jgi:farnesyl diphosphate synthase
LSRFQQVLAETAERVEVMLDRLLPRSEVARLPEGRVLDAMRYATLGGGKRLRPFLVMQSAALFTVAETAALRTAAALEMLHCYSLVHDDLPAMDDAETRRGRASCHRAYDDATAILAGDGLLTEAFAVLAHEDTHSDPAVRIELVAALSAAAGAHGMVGGQMLDLIAETAELDIGTITRLQRMKTGAIISFAAEAGAILGKAPPQIRLALRAYAHDLGLAFQIADDLLDAEGTAAETGKPVGRDAEAGKATFVSILGAERARAQAGLLADQAAEHLDLFGEKADLLRDLARFVVVRRA